MIIENMFNSRAKYRFKRMIHKDKYDFSYCYQGANILHYASLTGNVKCVKEILNDIDDVNLKDALKKTALHYAAQKGNLEVVKLLVEHGADVFMKDRGGTSALHYAAFSGNVDLVKYLVEMGLDVSAKDNYNATVLLFAVMSDSLEVVRFLLNHEIDINAPDDLFGRTVLHYVAQNRNMEMFKLLEAKGAKIDAIDIWGEPVMSYAIRFYFWELVQWFILRDKNNNDVRDFEEGKSPLHSVILEGYFEYIQWFIDHGADLNARDNDGCTVLHAAVQRFTNDDVAAKDSFKKVFYLETLQILLDHYADVNAADNYGWTALHYAASCNCMELVRWLLNHGADVDAVDKYGRIPMNYAEDNKNWDMVFLLAKFRAE